MGGNDDLPSVGDGFIRWSGIGAGLPRSACRAAPAKCPNRRPGGPTRTANREPRSCSRGWRSSGHDVQQIVQMSRRRIIRLCMKRGLLDDSQTDPLANEEPVLAAITAASEHGTIATGERAGQRLRRVLRDPATGVRTAPLCFASRGGSIERRPSATYWVRFSLHLGVVGVW